MNIGVLALQGSVLEHSRVVESQYDNLVLVKEPKDLITLDGLIIPGGESTTLERLLKIKSMDRAIINASESGLVIWGTCAGLILLANQLKLIDLTVERNGYGSHSDSFASVITFCDALIDVKFIRAPKILELGENVSILSEYNDSIVAAENKNIIVTSFHPEVTGNLNIYYYFKSKIGNNRFK